MSGMDRQDVLRRTRIAVSVFFAVLTIALVLLWIRSEWRHDVLGIFTGGKSAALFGSADGVLCLELRDEFGWREDDPASFYRSMGVRFAWPWHGLAPATAPGGFLVKRNSDSTYFVVPHWYAVAMASIPAAMFVGRWSPRYSLRSALVATTLIAVMLGMGVWLGR